MQFNRKCPVVSSTFNMANVVKDCTESKAEIVQGRSENMAKSSKTMIKVLMDC